MNTKIIFAMYLGVLLRVFMRPNSWGLHIKFDSVSLVVQNFYIDSFEGPPLDATQRVRKCNTSELECLQYGGAGVLGRRIVP